MKFVGVTVPRGSVPGAPHLTVIPVAVRESPDEVFWWEEDRNKNASSVVDSMTAPAKPDA